MFYYYYYYYPYPYTTSEEQESLLKGDGKLLVGDSLDTRMNFFVDEYINYLLHGQTHRSIKLHVFTTKDNCLLNDQWESHEEFVSGHSQLLDIFHKRVSEYEKNRFKFNRDLENGKISTIYLVVDDFVNFLKNTNQKESMFQLLHNVEILSTVGINIILSSDYYFVENIEDKDFYEKLSESVSFFKYRYYFGGISPNEEENLLGEREYLRAGTNTILYTTPTTNVAKYVRRIVVSKDICPDYLVKEIIEIRKQQQYTQPKFFNVSVISLSNLKEIKKPYLWETKSFENLEIPYSLGLAKFILDNIEHLSKKMDDQDIIETIYSKILSKDRKSKIKLNQVLHVDYNKSNYRDVILSRSSSLELDKNEIALVIRHYLNEYRRVQELSKSFVHLEKITVNGLFGNRNYRVSFTDSLNLFFAINGFGKTTILNILDKLFSAKDNSIDDLEYFSSLFTEPLDSIAIEFNNGSKILFNKKDGPYIEYKFVNSNDSNKQSSMVIDYKIFNDQNLSNNDEKQELLNYHHFIIHNYFDDKLFYVPLSNKLIDKDFLRLLSVELARQSSNNEGNKTNSPFEYQNLLKTYNAFGKKTDAEELHNQISNLCKLLNSSNLFSVKILNKQYSVKGNKESYIGGKLFKMLQQMEQDNFLVATFTNPKTNPSILYCHKEEFEKLAPGDDDCNASHCKYFDINDNEEFITIENIINQLFQLYQSFKEFKTTFEQIYDPNPTRKILLMKKGRIVVQDSNGQELSLDTLSSGEFNIFKVVYRIIFKSYSNNILLIDEPEISLHIAWQYQLMRIVSNVLVRKENMQMLITTHSPFIGSGFENFECKVELLK